MANKFSEKEFEEKISLSYPDWDHKILEFNGYKKEAKLKCKKCGREIVLDKASNVTRKVNICKCYKRFKDYHEKIRYLGIQCGFEVLFDGPTTQKKRIKCLKCGCEMERSLVSILNTPEHCDSCHRYREGNPHFTKEEIQQKLDEKFACQYELLEYQGLAREGLLKHLNCGYVFKIRELGDLFKGRDRGCPKCYQFKSIGEQKIRNYLDELQIDYIPQKTFAPLNKSKYRFDFFLPDYNLAIEYQGEQHYRENNFFKESYEAIHRRDKIKRKYCEDNNIELFEIKYTELKNIEAILDSRFNDYKQTQMGQNNQEKDIV